MKRQVLLLSIVAAGLVVALFFLLLYQPQRAALADVETEIQAQQDQQLRLQTDLSRLRQAREQAPEVEAELAAAEAIVPRDPALPAALRQLQTAGDEAGVILQTVSTSRPAAVEGSASGLSTITVSTQILGSYFQVVDFLRRTEDPSITPRGFRWGNVSLTKEEYPRLTVTLSGEMFVRLPAPPVQEQPAPAADQTDGAEDGSVTDVDVEIEQDEQ
jgi:Tfp pilus assembly protein PilO